MYNTAAFAWVVSHLALIGWPAVLYAAYRIIVMCFKVGRSATLIVQRVLTGEETLHLLASNHLPHLQIEMEKTNTHLEQTNATLKNIRDDLRLLMVKD